MAPRQAAPDRHRRPARRARGATSRSVRTRSSRRGSASERAASSHAHAVVRGPHALGRAQRRPPVRGHRRRAAGQAPRRRGPRASSAGTATSFREHVTVHGGTEGARDAHRRRQPLHGGRRTSRTTSSWARAASLANGVQLAGHASVEDWVTFGGLSGRRAVRPRRRERLRRRMAACERDVPPFVVVQGDRARVRALNVVGLAAAACPRRPSLV